MQTTLSFALPTVRAKKTRQLARARGFRTISDYLRFLLEQDDVNVISEDELVKRAKEVDRLHVTGKLIRAKSLKDLMA